jgi:murein DD-endopeptidase MepM/ murein hydrolase activator NlpD
VFVVSPEEQKTILDCHMPLPGTSVGMACSYPAEAVFDGNNYAILLQKEAGLGLAVYAKFGSDLRLIADTSTAVPNGSGSFIHFDGVSIEANTVVFQASGVGGQKGIYQYRDGELSTIADTSTEMPGAGTTYQGFGRPSLSNGNVAFFGSSVGHAGVYARIDGDLRVIADNATSLPGQGSGPTPPTSVDRNVSIHGDAVAFTAASSTRSLYVKRDDQIIDVLAGSQGALSVDGTAISERALSADSIAFRTAHGPTGIDEGIYHAALFAVFQAPFYKLTPHLVTQVPGGEFSHTGLLEFDVDLAQRQSDGRVPILASLGGTLRVHDLDSDGFGAFVTIDHGPDASDPSKSIFTVYAHLDSIRAQDGEIEAGTIIGIEGETGFATGKHLHFGVYRGDPAAEPFSGAWEKLGFGDKSGVVRFGTGTGDVFNSYDTVGLESLEGQFVFSSFDAPLDLSSAGLLAGGESRILDFLADGSSPLKYTLAWDGLPLAIEVVQPDGSVWPGDLFARDTSTATLPPIKGLWTFRIVGNVTGNSAFEFTLVPVPEPSTMTILTIASLLLMVRAIRSYRIGSIAKHVGRFQGRALHALGSRLHRHRLWHHSADDAGAL